jgi:hypothetical protein
MPEVSLQAGVAEWKTQRTQNPPVATPWGFESPLRHHVKPKEIKHLQRVTRAAPEGPQNRSVQIVCTLEPVPDCVHTLDVCVPDVTPVSAQPECESQLFFEVTVKNWLQRRSTFLLLQWGHRTLDGSCWLTVSTSSKDFPHLRQSYSYTGMVRAPPTG